MCYCVCVCVYVFVNQSVSHFYNFVSNLRFCSTRQATYFASAEQLHVSWRVCEVWILNIYGVPSEFYDMKKKGTICVIYFMFECLMMSKPINADNGPQTVWIWNLNSINECKVCSELDFVHFDLNFKLHISPSTMQLMLTNQCFRWVNGVALFIKNARTQWISCVWVRFASMEIGKNIDQHSSKQFSKPTAQRNCVAHAHATFIMCICVCSASIFIPTAFRNRIYAFLVGRSLKRLSSSLSILNVFIFVKLFASLQTIKLVLFFMVYWSLFYIDRIRWNTFACDEAFMFVGLLVHRLNDAICWCNDTININLNTMYDQFNPVSVSLCAFFFSLLYIYSLFFFSYNIDLVVCTFGCRISSIIHWCHRLLLISNSITHP